MQRPSHEAIVHGALGGIIAGLVVAVWFLILDVTAGVPLQTPERLAAAFLGATGEQAGFGLIVGYTVIHFAVFATLGVVTAIMLNLTRIEPGLLLGAIVGVAVLDGVYYTALLATGTNVWNLLPGGHVLAANVVSGAALMAFLHRASRSKSRLGLAVLKGHPMIVEGITTGLIGASAVALWFFVIDIAAGAPFRTPMALGSVVFLRADSMVDGNATFGMVAAYTVVHAMVFVTAGLALVGIARYLTRVPEMWLMFVMAFIVIEAASIPTLGLMAQPVLGASALWLVTIGNGVAVASMVGWTWYRNPALRERLLDQPVATKV